VHLADLLFVTVSVPPREIERFLDALGTLPYPVNFRLRYEEWQTHVEFPAYRSWLGDLQKMLVRHGFEPASLRYRPAVAAA